MCDLSQQEQQLLAEKLCPIVYFHPDEKYFPCSVEYYLRNSDLYRGNVFLKPSPQKMDLTVYNSSDDHLNIKEFTGMKAEIKIPYTVPTYVFIQNDPTSGLYRVCYSFLYCYNGAYNIYKCPCKCCEAGAHKYDLEHISIYATAKGEIQIVYFGAHGTKDGIYRNNFQVETTPQGRLIIYAARMGHGLYPNPRTYYRIFCAANDECSSKGISWMPRVEMINDKTDWNAWLGSWESFDAGDSPFHHEYYKEESQEETNDCKRICCP